MTTAASSGVDGKPYSPPDAAGALGSKEVDMVSSISTARAAFGAGPVLAFRSAGTAWPAETGNRQPLRINDLLVVVRRRGCKKLPATPRKDDNWGPLRNPLIPATRRTGRFTCSSSKTTTTRA